MPESSETLRCSTCPERSMPNLFGDALRRCGLIEIDKACAGPEQTLVQGIIGIGIRENPDFRVSSALYKEMCPKEVTPEHRSMIEDFEQRQSGPLDDHGPQADDESRGSNH